MIMQPAGPHIARLMSALLAMLLLVTAMPYRSAACGHFHRAEARHASSCCVPKVPQPAPARSCCEHTAADICCCAVGPMVLFVLLSVVPDGMSRAGLPSPWLVEPIAMLPPSPPIPPPRS